MVLMDQQTMYNREVYEHAYSEKHLQIEAKNPYDRHLTQLRFALLERYSRNKIVADLGCGTGVFLLRIAPKTKKIYGIDFSKTLLKVLKSKIPKKLKKKIIILHQDIQHLGLKSQCVDGNYSYATFYHVPDNRKATLEMGRILKPKGIAIIEFGNFWSLNTIIARKSPTKVQSYHFPVSKMYQYLEEAGLKVLDHKAFQLFPMYGINAWWMLPLLPFCLPQLKYVMGIRIRGKMLDEWVSSFPILNRFAFRHLFICKKLK